ncbi:acyltransferase family protein [Flavitalea flava]
MTSPLNMASPVNAGNTQERILSVDFLRGFTMFMLVSNFGQLFSRNSANPFIAFMGHQLEHADWEGLTAWDLVQPFFMFIVGVAMPFAFSRKWAAGESWNSTLRGALRRSLLLLFLGWLLSSEIKSTFTNVLAQLSVTYLIAFLLMRQPVKWQLLASFALIIFNDLLYRVWAVPGFDQPFTADHNFGSWFDIFLTGGLSEDRWVSFNAIPTTAHTIWGVIAGTVLMKDWPPRRKIITLLLGGLSGIVAGYTLGLYIPMIKRVCTSSFILASGGWALLMLAFCYLVIDVWKKRKGVLFFAIVGMNPLFIYLFVHTGGKGILESLAIPVTSRVFGWIGPSVLYTVNVLAVSGMLWYICYFLYKRQLFIRI